jgi:hypothetical protein
MSVDVPTLEQSETQVSAVACARGRPLTSVLIVPMSVRR